MREYKVGREGGGLNPLAKNSKFLTLYGKIINNMSRPPPLPPPKT